MPDMPDTPELAHQAWPAPFATPPEVTVPGYRAALERLLSVTSSPRLGLGRMECLLGLLGDPQRSVRAIHVAGTNGKGSTVAFLTALCRASGQRVGASTSPHLASACERVRVNHVPIAPALFVALEAQIADAAASMAADPPTFFERMTALAWLAFREAAVDIALIEVGLGGRLDASNVIAPIACGVGRIARDHERFLGNTLDAIAREKAGIAKPDVPLVVGAQQAAAVCDVVTAEATARGAPVSHAPTLEPDVALGLHGAHQRDNAALAVALFEAAGLGPAPQHALASATWPARLERLDDHAIWLDGAHNADGAAALGGAVARLAAAHGPVTLVHGATTGHDPRDWAGAFAAHCMPARVIATRARAPRSIPAADVAAGWTGIDRVQDIVTTSHPAAALRAALDAHARSGGLVLIAGSLYLAGEVRAAYAGVPSDPVLPLF